MKDKKYIVYLGCSGFPYGLAEIQKIIQISKGLVLKGNSVTIINSRGMHNKSRHPDLKATGNFEGVEFIYTSGTPFRPDRFIKRNWLKVKGRINEFWWLKKQGKAGKLDYAILSTHSFSSVLYYTLLSKLFGFKTILNYVEFFSGVKKKWFQVGAWANDKLYDTCGTRLVDANFPISEFLIDHLKKVAPGKRYLKIPVLTDLERFKDAEKIEAGKYFLFCGATAYAEVIKFTIDSFVRLNKDFVSLYLVINGSDEVISEMREHINNTLQKDRIKIFSRLSERDLNNLYKNAVGLLIPLRPSLQDTARFPHKIGEYLASGNPVISTNYGEVSYYFKDQFDMLIADSYDTGLFADKMKFVIDYPEQAKKIGCTGRDMATKNFDYRVQAEAINHFMN